MSLFQRLHKVNTTKPKTTQMQCREGWGGAVWLKDYLSSLEGNAFH